MPRAEPRRGVDVVLCALEYGHLRAPVRVQRELGALGRLEYPAPTHDDTREGRAAARRLLVLDAYLERRRELRRQVAAKDEPDDFSLRVATRVVAESLGAVLEAQADVRLGQELPPHRRAGELVVLVELLDGLVLLVVGGARGRARLGKVDVRPHIAYADRESLRQ